MFGQLQSSPLLTALRALQVGEPGCAVVPPWSEKPGCGLMEVPSWLSRVGVFPGDLMKNNESRNLKTLAREWLMWWLWKWKLNKEESKDKRSQSSNGCSQNSWERDMERYKVVVEKWDFTFQRWRNVQGKDKTDGEAISVGHGSELRWRSLDLRRQRNPEATGLDELSTQMMKTVRMAVRFGPKWITVS